MFITSAIHQIFAPELSDEELEAIMKGQETVKEKEESLIDGEVLVDEDDHSATLENSNDIGN